MAEAERPGGAGRREDPRLLSGRGAYVDDLRRDGALHAVFLRSPHAHARVALDVAAARAAPGVAAVWTAADVADAALPGLAARPDLARPDGAPAPSIARKLLAGAAVRHVGEPVAMVLAETRAAALDAAERIDARWDPLPAATDCAAALAEGAPRIWDEAAGNLAYGWRRGDREAVAAALAGATHVTRLVYGISRVSAAPLEPRAALAEIAADGRLTLHASTQGPYGLRGAVARALGLPPERVHVIARDVGGSFGMKAGLPREEALVSRAALKLGRAVRWTADRAEAFLADDHARDVRFEGALALDRDGRFLALDIRYDVNVGAYLTDRSLGPITNIGGVAGVYRTPAIAAEVRGVFTNTHPTAPYRGAGRPDATFAIERIIDVAASELGLDRIELRRRNLVPAEAMPWKTGFLFTYDCGDFRANMDEAAKRADLAGFPARRAAAARRGRLRGLGVCNPIEVAGGPFGKPGPDQARLIARPDGTLHLHTGAMSVGQGLETVFPGIVARSLGVDPARVVYHQGDTDGLQAGRGSGGSSGLCVSGSAVSLAADKLIEAGRALAADALEVAAADLEFRDGAFVVAGTDRSIALSQLAARAAEADADAPLMGHAGLQPTDVTFPNGCHVCEVEVDPETGAVEVVSYVAVEDVGRVISPPLVHGQIHGGVAQGLGQALLEQVAFDKASGQLLTGTFMDYAMPRASDLPMVTVATREVATAVNPLGAKGVGEAGTVGAVAAAINAVCDALAPLGVRHLEMPATPDRVWAAIRAASRAGKTASP